MQVTNRIRRRPGPGLFVCLAAALAAVVPGAGAAAAARTIGFEEAVSIALGENLSLLLADNQRGLDEASLSDARWQFAPDVRVGASGNLGWSRTQLSGGGTDWNGSRSTGLSASSSLTLFDGFANVSSLREARFERAAGELDYARARQTVVFQVISDYLAFIEATEQRRVREENLAAQAEQLEKVRALVEEGERPINELYQQEANVASAKLGLVDARRTLDLSRVDLVQTLHLDPLEDVDFAIPDPATLRPGGATGAFGDLVETAGDSRADLTAEETRLAATGERVTQAKANRWPTLSLSGSFSASSSNSGSGDLFTQLSERQSAGAGVSLSYPLFNRMQTRNSIRRAEISEENAEIALEGLRQDVALQVRRAVLDRDSARESLESATARVTAATEALSYTNERYLAGASTLYEVTLARADLVSAESAEVSARYRVLWQNRLVDYYVGTLDPDAGLGD